MDHLEYKSRTVLGDCIDVMKGYADNEFDFAVVDPPYGIDAQNLKMGGTKKHISTATKQKKQKVETGWDKAIPEYSYFSELFRVSKNQIICGGNYFPLNPSRGIVVWDKKQNWDSFSQVEIIWTSLDFPAKIFRKGNVGGNNQEARIHPTQKPVELYRFLFKTCKLQPEMKVLDTHLGSGSSRIAAEQYWLDFTGIEIDEFYFELQEERFDRYIQLKKQQLQIF